MKHLKTIDGLRGYLALWVLIGHVMAYSGYDDDGTLSGGPQILRQGFLAVNIFIIISGFVIFLLLDKREENYVQFICRRFFRLYPLYLVLFLASIPVSLLVISSAGNNPYLSPGARDFFAGTGTAAWANFWPNLGLHMTMLHGVVSDHALGGDSRIAFLGPAWSISLEWQFYLLAPLAFWLATKNRATRFLLCALCIFLLWLGKPLDGYGGLVLVHPEFFFIGAVSFYLYKFLRPRIEDGTLRDCVFPCALVFAAIVFYLGNRERALIPLGMWMVCFAIVLEGKDSFSGRYLAPLLTNRAAQFLATISYGLYLAHDPIITLVNAALLKFFPSLGQQGHFWLLLALVTALTVGAAALLHQLIEAPGMKLGRVIASKLKSRGHPVAIPHGAGLPANGPR